MRSKTSARDNTALHTLVLKSLIISNVTVPIQITFTMIQPTIARFCHLTSKTHTQAQEIIFYATRGLPLPFNVTLSRYFFITLQQNF